MLHIPPTSVQLLAGPAVGSLLPCDVVPEYFNEGWFLPLCSSQVTLSPEPQVHKAAESELLKSHQPCPAPEFTPRTPDLSQTAAPV